MTPRTLFPTDPPPPKLARESDPQTSHDAAKKTNSARDRERVLQVFRERWPRDLTAKEAAQKCADKHGEGDDHTRIETYRKRVGELKEIYDTGERRSGGRLFVLKEEEA